MTQGGCPSVSQHYNKQNLRIYAKKVNRLLAISKDYCIFANENCVFTQKK
jgi:hypothetical protein